jgi:hypothetical protein
MTRVLPVTNILNNTTADPYRQKQMENKAPVMTFLRSTDENTRQDGITNSIFWEVGIQNFSIDLETYLGIRLH